MLLNGWDDKVRAMLAIAHLEAKPAYTTTEAAVILAVSPTTIRTMCEQWEPAHCKRDALECYRIGKGDRRIPFHALAEYLAVNNEYDRV
jgi:hypothetical protein